MVLLFFNFLVIEIYMNDLFCLLFYNKNNTGWVTVSYLEVLITIVISSNDLRIDTDVKMSLTQSSTMMLNTLKNVNIGVEQSHRCLNLQGSHRRSTEEFSHKNAHELQISDFISWRYLIILHLGKLCWWILLMLRSDAHFYNSYTSKKYVGI